MGMRPAELRLTDDQLNQPGNCATKTPTGEDVRHVVIVRDAVPGPDGLTRSTVIGLIVPSRQLPEPGIPIDPGDLL